MRIEVTAAESEVLVEDHVLVYRGKEFRFPGDSGLLPGEAFRKLEKGQHLEFLDDLLGEKQEEVFWGLKPSFRDVLKFTNSVTQLYGFENLGESQASGGSSPTTSNRSRQTSRGPTLTTSDLQSLEDEANASVSDASARS